MDQLDKRLEMALNFLVNIVLRITTKTRNEFLVTFKIMTLPL
jgi:hypothetical protein